MASRKDRRREPMLSLCSEVGPEDGIDPRKYFREERSPEDDHRTQRLCGQVARTLALTLRGRVLEGVEVVAVAPLRGATRLLVTVGPSRRGAALDERAVLEALERAKGLLRSEVAAALERKRAPELVFRVEPEARS